MCGDEFWGEGIGSWERVASSGVEWGEGIGSDINGDEGNGVEN